MLVIILLAVFPGGMKSIFPGGGTAADETTEIEDSNYDEMSIFLLDEEGSPAAVPAEEVQSTQGGENETSMMSDF